MYVFSMRVDWKNLIFKSFGRIMYSIMRRFLCQVQICNWVSSSLNTLRPRQNGRHFPDDVFKCIFLNENVWISLKISLRFVSKVPIDNIPALVQVMAWRRPGDKPLSEPMMVSLLTHICVTRPQWVKYWWYQFFSFVMVGYVMRVCCFILKAMSVKQRDKSQSIYT